MVYVIHKWKLSVLLFVISVSFLGGCTRAPLTRMLVIDYGKPFRDKIKLATKKNNDLELFRDAMPAGIAQIEGFAEFAPDCVDILVSAAEANQGYAFAFVEDKDKARAARQYYKARHYALMALEQNEAFKDALDKPTEDFAQALNSLDEDDVPALFYASASWLSWINISDQTTVGVLMGLPKVEAMIDRMLVLDETFNHGGPHALMGSLFAARPTNVGGQPEEAKFHFHEAFEISESKYLLWQLFYAKYYAVQIQDRELFVTTLENIISAPEDLLPEENIPNEIARQKAKDLLAKVDEYFRPRTGFLK
jgi:hypothetical protein